VLTVGLLEIHKGFRRKYKSEDYDKLTDIVEVWFDSGSTHAYVLEKERI
jgi:Isoleucyl-tRNA synthetase (EC 6.1.1.5)